MYREHIDFLIRALNAGITADAVKEIRNYISNEVEVNDEDPSSRRLYDLLHDLSFFEGSDGKRAEDSLFERKRAEVEVRDAITHLETYDGASD